MIAEPPPGHSVRAATLDDAAALAGLFNDCTMAEAGVAWTHEVDMRGDLSGPDFDLDNDAALVLDAEGGLVAGLVLYPDGPPVTDVFALGLVHPDARDRGLGTFVTLLGEERARRKLTQASPTGRVTVHGSRFIQNDEAAQLFRDLGYENVRTWWRMTIDLADEAPPTSMPNGIALRPFDPERDARPTYEALYDAFRDHWGEGMRSFENWAARVSGAEAVRSFAFVAVEGTEIAGVVVGRVGTGADTEAGTIEELGVRRPWRGRGLGFALLRTAFQEFHRRGLARAVLNVDAESPTGATRLYERAGMRVEVAWDRWEKELRGGTAV